MLYRLAKMGWRDVYLIERRALTAGLFWHTAGGVNALNAGPNIAALGTIQTEHMVNAVGLWAKQVGRIAGVERAGL